MKVKLESQHWVVFKANMFTSTLVAEYPMQNEKSLVQPSPIATWLPAIRGATSPSPASAASLAPSCPPHRRRRLLPSRGRRSGPKNYERIEKVRCHAAKEELELGVKELELEEEEEEEEEEDERLTKLKQRMVSQVLEIGIIFHSVIIGVTLGMSQNQCTIRPLVVALAFHQVFEGMGLGGCIAQVENLGFCVV
ncbi:uncharacterized protein A4U43_C10F12270 [Asparagus officinalis]|uniref:Uncharacterized protein n=1 Tax=Asparagus officinalis TaxID=4686 RepID=A0A5P1E292_ASPOF|nr:uncharacterized protein A4U43_C10F12270 [Asparagus officinalis]